MKKLRIAILCFFAFSEAFFPKAFAENVAIPEGTVNSRALPYVQNATNSAVTAETTGNTATSYGLNGAPTNVSSANMSALGGQGSNSSAGQIAQQIGQQLISQGTSMMASCCPTGAGCCGTGAMLLAMGLAAMAQSGANKGTAKNHGENASMNTAAGNVAPTVRAGDVTNVAGFDGNVEDQVSKYGMKYDKATGKFTMPNGSSFTPSDLMSPSAMAAAGVSGSEYKRAMDMAKAAEAKAEGSKPVAPVAGFEGGGGSYAAAPATETVTPIMGVARSPTSVAGMVRSFGGGSIGVAGDSLFDMMARRYKEKNSKDCFLPTDSAPEEMARPAASPSKN